MRVAKDKHFGRETDLSTPHSIIGLDEDETANQSDNLMSRMENMSQQNRDSTQIRRRHKYSHSIGLDWLKYTFPSRAHHNSPYTNVYR